MADDQRSLQYKKARRERPTDEDAVMAEWEELASAEPGCKTIPPSEETEKQFGEGAGPAVECSFGRRSFVTLDNGVQAFLFDGPQYATVHWLKPLSAAEEATLALSKKYFESPVLEVFVLGPELGPEAALEIAAQV